MNGQEVARVGGIWLEFLAKTQDVIVDRTRRWIILIAPHFVEQLVARQDSSGRRAEEFQKLELLSGERNGLTGLHGLHAGEVDSRIAESEYFVAYGLGRNVGDLGGLCCSATHGAADAREEFFWAEGFGDIVVGAKLQQENFIFHFGIGTQHYDRHGGSDSLKFTTEFLAGEAGKL